MQKTKEKLTMEGERERERGAIALEILFSICLVKYLNLTHN